MEILIGIPLALIAGVVPMVVYALILWWFDRYEKEPLPLLLAAFLWGAIPAIIASLFSQIILSSIVQHVVEPAAANMIEGAIFAPLTEEIFKGTVLWLWILTDLLNRLIVRHTPRISENKPLLYTLQVLLPPFFREIDSPLDGIIHGAFVGLGFAAVENVFYFVGGVLESGLVGLAFLTVFRAFVFGLNHALFTGLTGWGVALARTSRHWIVKIAAPVAGLALAMLAHGVHNAGVSLPVELCWPCLVALASDWGGVLILLVVIIWATVREQRWIAAYLAGEIEMGTLSQEDYEVICSYIRRETMRAGAFFRGDFRRWWDLGRYQRLATELAFNKHRLAQFPGEGDTQERIVRLREQVTALGRRI